MSVNDPHVQAILGLEGGGSLQREGGGGILIEGIGVYRFLQDHYINDVLVPAGTILNNMSGWVPTLAVDPLDTLAVQTFYLRGPGRADYIHTQFVLSPVPPPVTFWKGIGNNLFVLTGLGSNQTTFPPVLGK